MTETLDIRPQPKQEIFLGSSADIAIYGGGAGAGKTFALLLEPCYHIDNADFGAVIFRRTMPEITKEKGLWDEAGNLYPLLGGRSNINERRYSFPSGARVSFSHLQYDSDLSAWRGAQIALIEFDQLETFTAQQLWYMLSRNRSTSGVRPYVRATCNPEPGWLADLLDWWIGADGFPIPERSGVLRWFVRLGEEMHWYGSRAEAEAAHPNIPPKSLTFIHANVYDNAILMEKDPGYLANLLALPYVDRERLLGGNWKVKPSAGKLINRAWIGVVPAAQVGGEITLFWDFAATEKETTKSDPDYTASVAMQKAPDKRYYTLDSLAGQWDPVTVERNFINISRQWAQKAKDMGASFAVRWEVEPGSAAKRESRRLALLLAGMDARGVSPNGDKITRGKPFMAQAEAGNVDVVAGDWNEAWLNHLHNQPDLPHDDTWDATTGAFNDLAAGRYVRMSVAK